jgi:hypothetical protein
MINNLHAKITQILQKKAVCEKVRKAKRYLGTKRGQQTKIKKCQQSVI